MKIQSFVHVSSEFFVCSFVCFLQRARFGDRIVNNYAMLL